MNNIEKVHRRNILSKSFLFNQLNNDDLDLIVEFTKRRSYKTRDTVLKQHDDGKELFVIAEGRVRLTTTTEEGKELLIDILGPGEIFGEVAFFDDQQRTATVTALEPCELIVLDRNHFLPVITAQPEVALRMLSALASRLRRTDRLLEDNLLQHLPERLARKLLVLADDFGEQTPEGLRIGVKLSQHDIGKMTGTSREGINKQLRIWEDEGVLTFAKGYVTITDSAALNKIANRMPVSELEKPARQSIG